MTDLFINELDQVTTVADTDLLVVETDPSGTPETNSIEFGDALLETLKRTSYQISRSVISNNLIVALKNSSGNDASTDTPLRVNVGGEIRTLTGALSVTVNAGTNTFSAGSAALATKEIDYFVYLGYRASDTSLFLLISRIPYAKFYSDFNTTATHEKYAAYSGAAPASTDVVVNIGRFNATLSAGAGYTWSVPATSLVVNHQIFDTRVLDFTCTITYSGGTTDPTSNTVNTAKYYIAGRDFRVHLRSSLIRGTGNRTIHTFTLPWANWVEGTSPANALTSFQTGGLGGVTGYMSGATFVFYNVTMVSDGTYYGTGVNTMS